MSYNVNLSDLAKKDLENTSGCPELCMNAGNGWICFRKYLPEPEKLDVIL